MSKEEASSISKLDLELRRVVVMLATLSQLRVARYGHELRQALADKGLPDHVVDQDLPDLALRHRLVSASWNCTDVKPLSARNVRCLGFSHFCQRLRRVYK
jgi:hypothetical protein